MSQDCTSQFQHVLDRLNQGDENARNELLERACSRLHRLAADLLRHSFPRLQICHEADSVLHETWLRLLHTLKDVHPATTADFFRLAAHKMRQVLLDLAERETRRQRREGPVSGGAYGQSSAVHSEPQESTLDPIRLACWSEFHQRVQTLPAELHEVVELYWYWGLTQAETAQLLGLPEKTISRRWIKARLRMAEWLPPGADLEER